jgi:hypothetical protein
MVGVDLAVNDVPIVGEPIAFGTGFIALLLVLFSRYVIAYVNTLAHEGGHMLANLVTLRGTEYWELEDNADGGTMPKNVGGWIRKNIGSFVGYATPSLLGLAGAALIAAGNPWAVLLASIVFSVLAVALSKNGLAFLVPALVALGFTWLLIAGSDTLQAAIAVGLAWVLLIGGLVKNFSLLQKPSQDGAHLAGRTLIPNFVWSLVWIFIAVVALIVGGQLLLRPGYDIG